MAYKKFSVTARASFENAIVALAEHFEPESRRDLFSQSFNLVARKEQSRGQILART